jgi:hypothetical protein
LQRAQFNTRRVGNKWIFCAPDISKLFSLPFWPGELIGHSKSSQAAWISFVSGLETIKGKTIELFN